MKFIELNNSNQMAIVDASMYDWLNQFAWYACTPSGKAMYARATVDGSRIFMHRLIARVVGIEAQTIDHINGKGLDNRQQNLRGATFAENCWNRSRKTGASGHRGVVRCNNGWVVKFTVNKKPKYFGFFVDLEEAKAVADAAAIQLRGEFDPARTRIAELERELEQLRKVA